MVAWGKADREDQTRHHLAHHSADVAAVLISLLKIPIFRNKANAAVGRPVSHGEIACLGALAFLHDIGKLATGFQVKGWHRNPGITPRGHVQCGWLWLRQGEASEALGGHAALLAHWADIMLWFRLLFAHHGRPVPDPGESWGLDAFDPAPGYDWKAEEHVMGEALITWFPEIRDHAPPPLTHEFAHFFAGVLALADWVGSDRTAFDFVEKFDPAYWTTALEKARRRLRSIGLDPSSTRLAGVAAWPLLSDHPAPRPAQWAVADVETSERLVILEAETGSGKTEAALWRFARLFEADEVEALYFAVPTRAAARQLQTRVNDALKRMFADPAPEAILAIPGQVLAGEARGHRLPEFRTRWNDTDDARPARWAAEHATRFLAAQIAVGTVDQVMMAGLKVKHAHLRGSSMSRALVVIDEVHASDAWMTEIQRSLVDSHLALGGHAMLMSATLGSVARATWRGEALPSLEMAQATAYPAVWTKNECFTVPDTETGQKTVSIRSQTGWSGSQAAELAVAAAHRGARVLVIRNTVDRARETWCACIEAAPDLVFSLEGVQTLHHSRFAAEDRARLDARVEAVLGAGRDTGGMVIVGTQTLEQSLDIDADFLITDLCPMDVLMQRIGRLHRHARDRPRGFDTPAVAVLCPEYGLDSLTREPENGLGAFGRNTSLSGVYLDVPGLAATLAEIDSTPLWQIPDMNRTLVEKATHPERLDEIARENGWQEYRRRVTGKAIAETQGAEMVILDRAAAFPHQFPDDEVIRTRIGEQGAILTLPEGTIGPFGHPVKTLALPVHWSRGLTGDEEVVVEDDTPLRLSVGEKRFEYGADGLTRVEE
ncbi:CRISPR-associated helicase Cas3' [Aquicoccus porphyridii]|uniref:CRISPR-associated helicase Cas3 n=1 Tax=Aquicoccus porphyridii TaxID=1852029 RepID=A0A5A9YYF4_9RHOB|nr:CRISPR-associated helicase Cas3' [Aquicoccus porphyridii]KAA0909894.1 CRISPR-associated helicase Cas3' [Aquicoccus porphyridii]RAI52817.1 CRISPR-associated helicase/endonuclease Cas3 [Rhodobacteraceae bacterium AsT-22]